MDIFTILTIVFFFIVCWQAISDAFYDNGDKMWSGIIKDTILAYLIINSSLVASPAPEQLTYGWSTLLFLNYVLLRWTFFDYVYNKLRGLPLDYVGTTKWTDRLLNKIFDKIPMAPRHILFISRFMALWVVIGIVLKSYWV